MERILPYSSQRAWVPPPDADPDAALAPVRRKARSRAEVSAATAGLKLVAGARCSVVWRFTSGQRKVDMVVVIKAYRWAVDPSVVCVVVRYPDGYVRIIDAVRIRMGKGTHIH
jgi:hypothetical protein